MSDDMSLTAEAGAVTLTRKELVFLTGDNYTMGNFDAPPKLGPVEYALNTLQACASDLHVVVSAIESDVSHDALGMMVLRLAYKMEAVESIVRRQVWEAKSAAEESEAAQ